MGFSRSFNDQILCEVRERENRPLLLCYSKEWMPGALRFMMRPRGDNLRCISNVTMLVTILRSRSYADNGKHLHINDSF